jgi:hypothetical protein
MALKLRPTRLGSGIDRTARTIPLTVASGMSAASQVQEPGAPAGTRKRIGVDHEEQGPKAILS